MTDFLPPPGPPPPKVPEGWKALWNEQYKEWFYVNIHTKKSQWEKPTEPAQPLPGSDSPPPGPPPAYRGNSFNKSSDFESNNPFKSSNLGVSGSASPTSIEQDALLAAKLQAEEQELARNQPRGDGRSTYINTPPPQTYNRPPQTYDRPPQTYDRPPQTYDRPPQTYDSVELPPRVEKKGLLSKLLGRQQSQPHYPAQSGGYGTPPPQGYYGGYPQQYPPAEGYGGNGGYPPQGYGGGYLQRPPHKTGIGTAGGAALGLGAGLVGGVLLEEAIHHHDQSEYIQGYEQGEMNADRDNYYGGDFNGGDFNRDDFNGGDFNGGGFNF